MKHNKAAKSINREREINYVNEKNSVSIMIRLVNEYHGLQIRGVNPQRQEDLRVGLRQLKKFLPKEHSFSLDLYLNNRDVWEDAKERIHV